MKRILTPEQQKKMSAMRGQRGGMGRGQRMRRPGNRDLGRGRRGPVGAQGGRGEEFDRGPEVIRPSEVRDEV